MLIKEFIQLRRDRVSFAMIIMIPLVQLLLFGYAINTNPRHLPTAVLLQEQTDRRPFHPQGAGEHQIFRCHPRDRRRGRVRSPARVGQGAVRDRDPGQFRARGAARRPSGAPGRGRCDRSGGRGLGHGGARPLVQTALAHDRAIPDGADGAVRDPHPCPLQSGGQHLVQHRAWPRRHHPHHDHADLHRAVGHARDRARDHGKPAGHADHAGRDHARQDHPLHHGRLRAGRPDHRHRHRSVRRSAAWEACCCSRC